MPVKRIVGIDFGTSTSVVRAKNYNVSGSGDSEAWSSQDENIANTHSVTFNQGSVMVPTLVRKLENGSTNYGYDAEKFAKGSELHTNFKVELAGENPESAKALTEEFLRYLHDSYEHQRNFMGDADFEKTIVSYPVKWGSDVREFMISAAKKAGFKNVEGMDEARAAINTVVTLYRDTIEKNGYLGASRSVNIMLIDMGAGTTDIVICRYTHSETPENKILCTWPESGEILFGGRELDEILQNYILEKVPDSAKVPFTKKVSLNEYKAWKESTVSGSLAKGEAVTECNIGYMLLDALEVEMDSFTLDRQEFEEYAVGYISKFADLVGGSIDKCIRTGAIESGNDIDLVITTGGHSQWYFVREMLEGKSICGKEISMGKIKVDPGRILEMPKPQETVALGLVYSKLPLNVGAINNASEEAAAQRLCEEVEQRAREEAEQRAREETERKFREEAEQRAREEAERKAQEEAKRKAQSVPANNGLYTVSIKRGTLLGGRLYLQVDQKETYEMGFAGSFEVQVTPGVHTFAFMTSATSRKKAPAQINVDHDMNLTYKTMNSGFSTSFSILEGKKMLSTAKLKRMK